MGFSTRLDVPLRAYLPQKSDNLSAPQTFTDLDVLGITTTGSGRLYTIIVDCKTSRSRATERMFWVRGVAELFKADESWMVRTHEPPPVTRQLSARLNIAALTPSDLERLANFHPTSLPMEHLGLKRLFDVEDVAQQLQAYTALDAALRPLLDYRQFDYFVYDEYRNPIQLVAHLRKSARKLDARNPLHCSLFMDLAWLELVSIARMIQYVRATHVSDLNVGMQEYLLGGQLGLREKQELASALNAVLPDGAPRPEPLPDYFPAMRETVMRVLRRPDSVVSAMRYAEVASAGLAARRRTPLPSTFGDTFDAVAAKLLADVCGYLVAAGGLDNDFRVTARQILLDEQPAARTRPSDAGHEDANGGERADSETRSRRRGWKGSGKARPGSPPKRERVSSDSRGQLPLADAVPPVVGSSSEEEEPAGASRDEPTPSRDQPPPSVADSNEAET